MNRSIRWLLAESKVSQLNPNVVNFDASTNKLICYHLTSHKKWAQYNPRIDDQLKTPERIGKEKTISVDDNRAQKLLKVLHNKNKDATVTKSDIEEEVISDIMSDPYTDSSGFNPGSGNYHGVGLYTCFKFNPSIAHTYGNICLVFEIDISKFLICFKDLAKQVHGEDWKIKDQIKKIYSTHSANKKSFEAVSDLISEFNDTAYEMTEELNSEVPNSQISMEMRKLFKNEQEAFYDGIILFGTQDGPVCVSFLPQYDAKLVGLGRLNKERPDIVDWYDSLNDFVGGSARNKLDFDTMNDIAEENSIVEEKEEMKTNARKRFNARLIWLNKALVEGNFNKIIEEYNKLKKLPFEADDLNDLVLNLSKYSGGLGHTFHTHGNSLISDVLLVKQKNNIMNSLIEDILKSSANDFDKGKFCTNFLTSIIGVARQTFYISDYNVLILLKNLENTEGFFNNWNKSRIESCIDFFNNFKEKYTLNSECLRLFDDFRKNYIWKLGIESNNILDIIDAYKTAPDPDFVAQLLSKKLEELVFISGHNQITTKEKDAHNELFEKAINLSKGNANFDKSAFEHFQRVINQKSFQLSDEIFSYIFSLINDNTSSSTSIESFRIERFISDFVAYSKNFSVPEEFLLQSQEYMEEAFQSYKDRYENLKLALSNKSKVVKKSIVSEFINDISYANIILSEYIKSLSTEEIKSFIVLIIENQKKIPGNVIDFIFKTFMSRDIVIDKNIQLVLLSKMNKSDYSGKSIFASYPYIDPEVFILLVEEHMKKGGMGHGLVYKGFESSPVVYKLLYKNKSVVEMFARSAKHPLLNDILANLINLSIGLRPQLVTHPYPNQNREYVSLSEIIDANNKQWFLEFVNILKASSSSNINRVKRRIAELERVINLSHPTNAVDNLDLSHRIVLGNTLKEVYNFYHKRIKQ